MKGLWRSQVAHRTFNPVVEGPNPSRPAFSSLRIPALNQKERHTFKLQRARHNLLKENQDVKRWYDNLARGSRNTANVRLRRLGLFCEQNHTTPQELAEIGEKDSRKVEDILFDHISYMESSGMAPGYIENTRKAIKSWLEFNYIELKRKIKIKNATIPITLQDEKIPEKHELQEILNAASPRARTIVSFVAFAGLRPQTLGNDIGNDGIVLSDISDLVIQDDEKIHFRSIPAMVTVKPSLSKAGHKYFTFLPRQGCEYLLGYLSQRRLYGEILTPDSSVIAVSYGYDQKRIHRDVNHSSFITTTTIRDELRSTLRTVIKERPYVLRSYFDTQLLLAESHGKIAHDFRVFFMGHKGSIEARYTTNKGRLPESLISEMKRVFMQSEPYLSTWQNDVNKEQDKKEILLEMWKDQAKLYGIDPMKIKIEKQRTIQNPTSIAKTSIDNEIDAIKSVIQNTIRGNIRSEFTSQTDKKEYESKIVDNEDELLSYVEDGWNIVKELSNGRIILRRNHVTKTVSCESD